MLSTGPVDASQVDQSLGPVVEQIDRIGEVVPQTEWERGAAPADGPAEPATVDISFTRSQSSELAEKQFADVPHWLRSDSDDVLPNPKRSKLR